MKTRATQLERLDNLSLQGDELHQTLKSLAWINRYFGNHQSLISALFKVIKNNPRQSTYRIVDLGCGGGDLLLAVATALQKEKISFTMMGIDGNSASLAYAKKNSSAFPQIKFQQADILAADFSLPNCDILISSHFIYHFSDLNLIHFLKKNLPFVKLAFINSGLERKPWAKRLFKTSHFLLPISKLAKEDGLLAIQRAFTKKELSEIAKQTADKFVLHRVPFFRLLLTLSTNEASIKS